MHLPLVNLKATLTASGLVTEEQFATAVEEAERTKRTVLNVIVGRGDAPEEYVVQTIADEAKVSYIDLRRTDVDEQAVHMIPESIAKTKNLCAFAFDTDANIVKVAMEDPNDLETIEFLRARVGAWVEPHATSSASLTFAWKLYQEKVGENFRRIIEENIAKATEGGVMNVEKMARGIPIISILDTILENAVALNASDLHFEPLASELLVRFRIDGVMQEILKLPKVIDPILVARVKLLSGLQIDEHRTPQDGRFSFKSGDTGVDVRVSVIPTFFGEKAEMRLLKGSARPLSLSDLGFAEGDRRIVEDASKKTYGMILATGPTGSGKTTTLYALLHTLNRPEVNICTVEDPIEYSMPRINQTQVSAKSGITFANGLRALLRQNPDIIMVGEIRDEETVEIAIHSSLTGHLVLSTLHTNDAASAAPRMLDMGAEPYLVASTLNVVMAQRLVRRICVSCVSSVELTPETQRLITAQIALTGEKNMVEPSRLYRGIGCKMCHGSGYKGQIGIYEVLNVTNAIRELILAKSPAVAIKQKAIEQGMTTLFHDGLRKVEEGVTTIDEVLRVIRE
ncbi:type II/IV secretion system protein [Candidatus Uhrbacteria bacterium]|nr:type II/IV secretion system protein [Candidatus Uhrbacteria bacterium]